MRRGELFQLEWRDIDLTKNEINIRKETTKTGKGRVLPMLSNVRDVFENLCREAGEVHGTDKIFFGVQSQANTFSRKFQEICLELGFKESDRPYLSATIQNNDSDKNTFANKDKLQKLYKHLTENNLNFGTKFLEKYNQIVV